MTFKVLRDIQKTGAMVVFLVAFVVAIWLYRVALLPLASIGWDEGVHLLDALNVATPLQRMDISQVMAVSFGQFFYPPGYSLAVGLWSLVGGVSLTSFRLFSLLSWVLSSIFVYLLSVNLAKQANLSEKKMAVAGLVSAGLFLSAPIYWIFGTEAMLELPGVLGTLIVAWLISKASLVKGENLRGWLWAGEGLAVLHFIKYNYAMWVMGALVAATLLELWVFRGQKAVGRMSGLLIALGVMAVVWVLWVMVPGRLTGYLHYFNDPNFYSYELIPFWQHLVWFFPMAILNEYLASPWLGMVVVVGIFGLVFGGLVQRSQAVRIFGLIFAINLFFATIHFHNQQSRYLITGVPFLYILSGVGLAKLFGSRPRIGGLGKPVGAAILVVGVFLVGRDLRWDVIHIQNTGEHLLGSPIYALAEFRDTGFDFERSHWPGGSRLAQSPGDVLEWVVQNSDPNRNLQYFGRTNEVSPPALEYLRAMRRLSELPWQGGVWGEYALTLEVEPNSVLNSYDYRKMNMSGTEAGLRMVIADQDWKKLTEKNFDQLGVSATIWVR